MASQITTRRLEQLVGRRRFRQARERAREMMADPHPQPTKQEVDELVRRLYGTKVGGGR